MFNGFFIERKWLTPFLSANVHLINRGLWLSKSKDVKKISTKLLCMRGAK
jgi:hypothetical protein